MAASSTANAKSEADLSSKFDSILAHQRGAGISTRSKFGVEIHLEKMQDKLYSGEMAPEIQTCLQKLLETVQRKILTVEGSSTSDSMKLDTKFVESEQDKETPKDPEKLGLNSENPPSGEIGFEIFSRLFSIAMDSDSPIMKMMGEPTQPDSHVPSTTEMLAEATESNSTNSTQKLSGISKMMSLVMGADRPIMEILGSLNPEQKVTSAESGTSGDDWNEDPQIKYLSSLGPGLKHIYYAPNKHLPNSIAGLYLKFRTPPEMKTSESPLEEGGNMVWVLFLARQPKPLIYSEDILTVETMKEIYIEAAKIQNTGKTPSMATMLGSFGSIMKMDLFGVLNPALSANFSATSTPAAAQTSEGSTSGATSTQPVRRRPVYVEDA